MVSFTITNKQRSKASIVMLVGLYCKQYKKSIGVGVPVKYWNAGKKRAKVTADFNGEIINEKIDAWEEIGKKAINHFKKLRYSPSNEEFAEKIIELSTEEEEEYILNDEKRFFCDYIERIYIPRYSMVREKLTVVKYTQALHKLREFEHDTQNRVLIVDINIDFYNRFQHWFYGKGYSRNYFGNIIKIVKQVYRESRVNDRLHDEHGTDHRDFIAPKDAVDNVYLDLKELEQIYTLNISQAVQEDAARNKAIEENIPNQNKVTRNKAQEGDNIPRKIAALERARGLFLIGCYTGLRVSDFSRLSKSHIGHHITIKTHKTGTPVVIPIHPVVREIIDNGFNLTDTISDQKLNEQIKELCRLANITEKVMVNRNEGGRDIEHVLPKYKLVSSHTARRSFATNAYKAGVPTIGIMKLTGHTKESTFLKYIKVSAQENAEMLSQHPFFTQNKN